jgi:hypothetical protein
MVGGWCQENLAIIYILVVKVHRLPSLLLPALSPVSYLLLLGMVDHELTYHLFVVIALTFLWLVATGIAEANWTNCNSIFLLKLFIL